MSHSQQEPLLSPYTDDPEGNERSPDDATVEQVPVQGHLTRRRRHALVLGCLSIALITVIAVALSCSTRRSDSQPEDRDTGGEEYGIISNDPRLEKYMEPSDARYCSEWAKADQIAGTRSLYAASFKLDASAELLFFISRGHGVKGNLRILRERVKGPDILVNVTAEGVLPEDLDNTKACYAGTANENGIMLFTESKLELGITPIYNITMQFPDTPAFGDVSTDFSNGAFMHYFGALGDIWRPTFLGELRIKADNAPVTVESMVLRSGFIETRNAEVNADLWAVTEAHVRTTNAPVLAMIWALGQSSGAEIKSFVRTSNGNLQCFVVVASDYDHVKLSTDLHTSNGVLDITMPRMGMMGDNAVVSVRGTTSNAPINILLSPDFQGSFALRTTGTSGAGGKAEVQWDPELHDPSGRGGKHMLDLDVRERTRVEGKMYWGEHVPVKAEMSDIRVATTVGDVWLYSNYDLVGDLALSRFRDFSWPYNPTLLESTQ